MNIAKALLQLFPKADPMSDFIVCEEDGKQRIASWKLDAPKPTQADIDAAFAAAVAAEATKVPEKATHEVIAELKDENAKLIDRITKAEQDNVAAMTAIADIYKKLTGGK